MKIDYPDTLKDYTVLSGSFNPIHLGHFNLTCAAQQKVNSGNGIMFEIALKNADKAALSDPEKLAERVWLIKEMGRDYEGQVAVVLSNEPLFLEKVTHLK
jgi:phosphopantetheine adenylyltransferase